MCIVHSYPSGELRNHTRNVMFNGKSGEQHHRLIIKNIKMKTIKLLFVITQLSLGFAASAQHNVIIPDLLKINESDKWIIHNRDVNVDNEVHLNGMPGDGILWLNDVIFTNGKIELDIKGKDERGRSFVGLAFHGLNDSTFDAIYFRPFNFMSAERNGHSVQYISHPEYTWYKLREEHPGEYENPIIPVLLIL